MTTNSVINERPTVGAGSRSTRIDDSPLFLPGWLEFNRARWHSELLTIDLGACPFPHLKATLFQNEHRKIWRPPLVPYLSVGFLPSPAHNSYRLTHQWLELGTDLATAFLQAGVSGELYLPPAITDVRPWNWAGFQTRVKYTFFIDFPYTLEGADHNVRAKIRRASDGGYRCVRVHDMQAVHACISQTAVVQDFFFDLTREDLELAARLLGADHLRTYVCYAPNGEPASTRVVLSSPGSRALVWLAGTNGHLQSGATELLVKFMIDDLQQEGAGGLDFVGANLRGVADAKCKWGGTLVPFYTVAIPTMKEFATMWYGRWRSRHSQT